jgi:hypothetical protein
MNILFPVPAGQNDYNPIVRSLNAAAETLDTIITPGFLNKVLSVGNTINKDDIILISYANGSELFIQNRNSEGVITLSPANQTIPFGFTNVQFVAQGGSDLNPGNNINQPKLTIQAAIDAITTGGLVWVLDSAIYSQPLNFNKSLTLYAPNALFILDAVSGSLFTQADIGSPYVVYVYASIAQASGGATVLLQNGSFSSIAINAQEIIGPAALNGSSYFNAILMANSKFSISPTAQVLFNVSKVFSPDLTINIGAIVEGQFGDSYYGIFSYGNQLIWQQQESQETVGRTVLSSDSNSTINYMNASTGSYVLPNSGIPVGTRVTFMQLSSGAVQFDSDGSSTILSYLNSSPVRTNGLNAVGVAEQISAGVWMISGNLVLGIGP